MAKTVDDLFTELRTLASEFSTQLETEATERKKIGDTTGETKQFIERLNARMDDIERERMRPTLGGVDTKSSVEAALNREAFVYALKYGIGRIKKEYKDRVKTAKPSDFAVSPEEEKALSLGDDTLGGYLAVPEFVDDIIKASLLYSPVRSYATVRKTNNRSVQMPIRNGTFAAKWVSETGLKSETTGLAYGRKEISNNELYAEVLISNQDLEDSAFDMDQQIQLEASEQFGIAEGAAFVNGTGVGQPEGFMTNSKIVFYNMGNTTALQFDGIVDAIHKLKTPYAVNATMFANRLTVGGMRKIKDSQNRPLWEPGIAPGNPSTVFGMPIVEMPDMPDYANGTYPIAFGDFKRAYVIVDRVQMVVQRLIEKYAENNQVAYIFRKRVGGMVVLPEAIVKIKMA